MRKAIGIIAVVLLFTAPVQAADVTDIELSHSHGFTQASISVDGRPRYTHQIEEAKDGMQFRVIIDVLSAVHRLKQKNFTILPECNISSIRSSQFSVKPEKVVRLVFDMKGPVVYRVEGGVDKIDVFFAEEETVSFTPWKASSVAVKKVEIASTKPAWQPSKKLLQTNVVDKRANKVKSAKAPVVVVQEPVSVPVPKKVAPRGTFASRQYTPSDRPIVKTEPTSKEPAPVEQPVVVAEKSKSVAKQPPAKAKVKQTKPTPAASELPKYAAAETGSPLMNPDFKSEVIVKKTAKVNKPVVPKSTEPKVKAKTQTIETPKTVAKEKKKQPVLKPKAKKILAKTATADKKVVANKKTEAVPPVSKSSLADKPSGGKKANSAQLAANTAGAKKDKARPTSRFRRSAKMSKKLRGTLVAEFPQRLVIKYEAKKYRDPFATLINKKRIYHSPIEKRVPSVEGLKLVGLIEPGTGDNRALFEDAEGFAYILTNGDRVQKGYVLRVESDRVYFQIFEYGWSRTVALTMEY